MKKLLIPAFAAVVLAGCNVLDKEPLTSIAPSNFFKTSEDAEASLTATYDGLQRKGCYAEVLNLIGNMPSDDCSSDNTDVRSLDVLTWTSTTGQVYDAYRDAYATINRANSVLKYVPGISTTSLRSTRRDQILGEARFIRALCYFNLVRLYGAVPLRLEPTETGDPAVLKAVAAKFERAATVAPKDWLPRYYQTYALLISVFQSKEDGDTKDKTLDQAEAALAQARQLHGDESELLALQAYAYQARLGISPMSRSMKYSQLVGEAVAQAQALNPANPRPYLVEANQVNFTPKMFGGGAEAAKPLYEQAQAKFAAFVPAGPLAPNWGQRQLRGRLKQYE
ncbi:RagB/SusD family nutrient uptake outer membrane protein, partial [Hymenobacter agri]